jgi:prostaglandin-endoperoxide synthase 2
MSALDTIVNVALHVPWLGGVVNRFAINRFANATKARPRPYSLWSAVPMPAGGNQPGPICDYTSWPSLTDRSFSGRHLPPADQSYVNQLPPDTPYSATMIGDVTALFRRSGPIIKDRSSVLFAFFAQWFTDSFLRIDGVDRRRNTSNHEIDLCQIYGLDERTTNLLRSHSMGKLTTQHIDNEEYPDYLFESDGNNGWRVKQRYETLPYVSDHKLDYILQGFPAGRRAKLYATGLERGNSTIGYVAISTLFVREHNRICDVLHSRNLGWDDERLFQTARMINIVMLLKIVVEEYINHISGQQVFRVDTSFPEQERWYRTNWMALEFDMLYRWHGLVPDTITLAGKVYAPGDFRTDNEILEKVGVGALFRDASSQPAGKIGLFNTPSFLLGAEYQNIKMGRDFRVRPYNDYRVQFGLSRLKDFSDLTGDQATQAGLRQLYSDMDNVEFIVGLFAEESTSNLLFGELMTFMVASDAFTQALTNPLLSTNIFNATTFTDYGLELIGATNCLQDLVNRNVRGGTAIKCSFGV